jgi:hypothetical protein
MAKRESFRTANRESSESDPEKLWGELEARAQRLYREVEELADTVRENKGNPAAIQDTSNLLNSALFHADAPRGVGDYEASLRAVETMERYLELLVVYPEFFAGETAVTSSEYDTRAFSDLWQQATEEYLRSKEQGSRDVSVTREELYVNLAQERLEEKDEDRPEE